MKVICFLFISVIFLNPTTSPTKQKHLLKPTKFIHRTITQISIQKYRPFKTFKKDTLKYLEQNFEQRKRSYINRPLIVLFKDLELPILQGIVSEGYKFKSGCGVSFNDSISLISLYLEKDGVSFRKFKIKKRPNILVVKLKPFPADSAWLLSKKYCKAPSRWPKEVANFYANKLVEDITLISK